MPKINFRVGLKERDLFLCRSLVPSLSMGRPPLGGGPVFRFIQSEVRISSPIDSPLMIASFYMFACFVGKTEGKRIIWSLVYSACPHWSSFSLIYDPMFFYSESPVHARLALQLLRSCQIRIFSKWAVGERGFFHWISCLHIKQLGIHFSFRNFIDSICRQSILTLPACLAKAETSDKKRRKKCEQNFAFLFDDCSIVLSDDFMPISVENRCLLFLIEAKFPSTSCDDTLRFFARRT